MKEIVIESLSDVGEKALRSCLDGNKNQSKRDRMIYTRMFNEIISDKPRLKMQLIVIAPNIVNKLNKYVIKDEFVKNMRDEGAKEKQDYVFKFIN